MKNSFISVRKKAAIITNNIHCGRHVQYFSTVEKYFKSNGWIIVDHFNVEKIIICSCGFHDAMYEKTKKILEEIKKTDFLEKNIIMMGCLTKTHQQELEEKFKGQVIPFHREHLLDDLIQAGIAFNDIPPVNLFKIDEDCDCGNEENKKFHIKISEGCLRECTFCIINKAKGYLSSIPFETIAHQVRKAISGGRKKIHLMGEDTFAYGVDIDTNIIQLVKKIKAIDKELQLYFGYLHSRWLQKYAAEIISLCKEGVLTELQIGLQHVNEEILKKMGRPVAFSEIYDIIAAIKKGNPDFYLIVDILVGFPGETEEMFNELVHFFENDRYFNKVKHFAYSDVKGALSYRLADKLPRQVIADRWQHLDTILGERSYSAETNETRADNETFRKTRFDDYFFCKDSFNEDIDKTTFSRQLAFAESHIIKQDEGNFGF